MARPPVIPGAPPPEEGAAAGTAPSADPEQRVTLTMAELQAMIDKAASTAAAKAVAQVGIRQTAPVVQRKLPTLEEAKALAESQLAEGTPPASIETDLGHYVHPMFGSNADVVETFLSKREKKAEAKAKADAAKALA